MDCGASGSALDRTARAILSNNNGGGAAKQVASVVGHALGGNTASVRPLTSPDRIMLPNVADATVVRPSQVVTPLHATPQQRQQLPIMQQQHHHHQHHPHVAAQHFQISAAAQQQQMILMQQQMQLMILQQQQHGKMTSQKSANLETWHEGLDREAKEELQRHLESLHAEDEEVIGHEGIVKGATIEDLAAAWTEAQKDYENSVEASANLWSGGENAVAETYEFVNKVAPEELSSTTDHNWMEEGMRQFNAGNLKEAICAFEMELQHHNADNATAWRMLGQCHAENDMDQQAILCLEQAVDRDPYSPEALLALGVSYVNELNHQRALENLKAWITHNPTFAGLELDDDVYGVAGETSAVESAFDDVQRLLLRALEYAPSESADVLEALGVVYNVSRDFDAAVDAFQRAIDLRSDDYQLWNKLGATLANGNRSEEALPAYHKALQLKPKYARAWLNMAISHSNLQNYDEAARCYLQTLSLNPSALHCWSYLRIALSCSESFDLIPLVAAQDLKGFQEHFDFVLY